MMETPNLMDVPTHATRRIERYGVLALILFLTTFGVLYLWEKDDPKETTVAARPGEVIPGYHPRSTERPSRYKGTGDARTERMTRAEEVPLARMDSEQEHLAMVQDTRRAEREGASGERRRANDRGRRDLMRHLEGPVYSVQTGTVGGPARDVSVSGYTASMRTLGSAAEPTPASAEDEMEYVVEAGDCLSKIAERELGSVVHLSRLLRSNNLGEDSLLRVGQRLILPHISETAPVQGTDIKLTPASDTSEWQVVEVREGESLWKIAARYLGDGSRYHEIMKWNALSSEMVHPGTKLKINNSEGATLVMRGER